MKRPANMRWVPAALLALLALPLLPGPAIGQAREIREKQKQALLQLEEQLAEIREQFRQQELSDEEAKARYEAVLAELREVQGQQVSEARQRAHLMAQEHQAQALMEAAEARERAHLMAQEHQARALLEAGEARERALLMAEEHQAQAEFLAEEAAHRHAEFLAQSEKIEQERQLRSEDARRRARELAIRVRERSDEVRAQARDQARKARQVVVRMRARVRLGVTLDPGQGEEIDRQGVLISGVMEDSPAEEAGLEDGDILTHLDGISLVSPLPDEGEMEFDDDESLPVQRLMALAKELEDGQEVEIRYLRDGDADSVMLTAAEMEDPWVSVSPGDVEGRVFRFEPEEGLRWSYRLPDDEALHLEIRKGLKDLDELDIEIPELHLEGRELRGWNIWEEDAPNIQFFRRGEAPNVAFYRGGGDDFTFEFMGRHRIHGVELRELNADLGEYFSTEQGVLVLEVDEDSTLGLRSGDVILRIGDREVDETRDVYRILSSYEDEEGVTFTVMRRGQETRVEGTIG